MAGLYAEKSQETTGKYGTASSQAQAKVEAKATFDATGKLNLNGLDLSVGARARTPRSRWARLDVNHDGKLGLDDVSAAGSKIAAGAASVVSGAASTVRSWLPW